MSTEQNKKIVLQFNNEFIAKNNASILSEIVDENFINHTAAAGIPKGVDGLKLFLDMLHNGFSDFEIIFHEQVAENDMVCTLKSIHATHTGEIMGKAPTAKRITFSIMDMVRLKDGKYLEHWGRNNILQVIEQL